MMDIDVVVIGSGISALKALYVAKLYNRNALAVDVHGGDGGYIQLLDGEDAVAKAPLFIDLDEADFLHSLGIDVKCYEVKHSVLKSGNYVLKTVGFIDIDVQMNWFTRWLNSNKLCFDVELFTKLKKSYEFPTYRPIHSVANIRKIDVEKKILALSTGTIIKYSKIVYTWPLELLPQNLYPNSIKNIIEQFLNQLELKYVSLYIYTTLAKSIEPKENLITIYTHATKASKIHTAIALHLHNKKIMYTATSYTKQHPLIPGIREKIVSELKKHRITNSIDALKKHYTNITYGLLNKINENILKELEQLLENHDIILFGRIAQWREKTIKEILTDKTIEQKIA